MKGALAIFAKTPGISPVKTRLAADIGVEKAEEFYHLSLKSIEEVASRAQEISENNLTPYWALAEEKSGTNALWQKFPTIWTGEGDLGNRLHNIYSNLLKTHDFVVMIGSDSPQLTPELLIDASKLLAKNNCVIGSSIDGGFYLFAAKIVIAKNIWMDVKYSEDTTLDQLVKQLNKHDISAEILSKQGDVDTIADLEDLMRSLEDNDNLLPAQMNLQKWLGL